MYLLGEASRWGFGGSQPQDGSAGLSFCVLLNYSCLYLQLNCESFQKCLIRNCKCQESDQKLNSEIKGQYLRAVFSEPASPSMFYLQLVIISSCEGEGIRTLLFECTNQPFPADVFLGTNRKSHCEALAPFYYSGLPLTERYERSNLLV